jgi:SAM-dependent methyltransferase
MERESCVICSSERLEEFLTLKNMPIFMGVVDKHILDKNEDMIFCECQSCGNVQIKSLLLLDMVYQENHNIDTVGETWKNHYIEFHSFMSEHLTNSDVLEIGDPSAKIASLSTVYKEWRIIENNPAIEDTEKIKFEKKFFDEEYSSQSKHDVIVNSHLFEHLYNPKKFLEKCHELLNDDGFMYISVPDQKYFLEGDFFINSILSFEHTYYIDNHYMKLLCDLTNFEIVDVKNYINHSVFFKLKKKKSKSEVFTGTFSKLDLKSKFLDKYHKLIDKVSSLNDEIENLNNVYLYSAHITSQSLLFNGLNKKKILGLIDASKNKVGKYLFGTELMTHGLDFLNQVNNPTVICSNMGIYQKEITDTLKKFNSKINLL